jgi:triacylglycerol lipase
MLDKSPPTGHPHGIVPERSPRSPLALVVILAAGCAGAHETGSDDAAAPPVADAAPDFPDAAPDDGSPDRPGSPAEPTDARRPTVDAAPTRDAARPPPRLDASASAPDASRPPPAPTDAAPGPAPERRPIVFVHGINGSHADFDVMVGRFVDAGWPRDWLVALDYPDPAWGCNADNGAFLDQTVERLRRDTGARTVDVIAHSMGALSSRYYLQRLGGHEVVAHYVTLGGLHHGNQWSCLNPLPVCVWQELCPTNPFLSDINGDADAPGTPVAVCICSSSDETSDLETCVFEPMENIQVDGPTHSGPTGVLEHEITWPIVLEVIGRPVADAQ